MRHYLPLFLGYFTVMALSNAIVPVLPFYAPGTSVHGLIYAGYFLGAFFITLPAGILTDRYGRIPFIRLGLAVSLASGLFLAMVTDPVMVIAGRIIEGIGAGFFVAAAMAAVNTDPDHVRMSGWLMASQNAGLVTGLAVAGWLAANRGSSSSQSGPLAIPTTRAMLPARSTVRAISFGVFCRLAASIRPIIRSRKDSPGSTLIRMINALYDIDALHTGRLSPEAERPITWHKMKFAWLGYGLRYGICANKPAILSRSATSRFPISSKTTRCSNAARAAALAATLTL